MNIQVHHVLSDITGATGMAILRALVAGNHDPKKVALLRDVRCKASAETVQAALTGHYRPEHLFALRQALERYDSYQAKVKECDHAIEAALLALHQDTGEEELPPARHKARQANEPNFNVRAALFGVLGTDLTQLHGIRTQHRTQARG